MKTFKINRTIFAVGALVLGIILLIWPTTSLKIIAKCIGAILAAGGVAAAVYFFRDHEKVAKTLLLVMAVVMFICGAVIFFHPEELVKLIPTIIGILVLVSGLLNLGETFLLTRNKYGGWWGSLIISILTIAAGIFVVSKAYSFAALITRIAGGALIFSGASDLWVISRLSAVLKGAMQGQKQETVDGTATEVTHAEPETAAAENPASSGQTPETAEAERSQGPASAGQEPAETAEAVHVETPVQMDHPATVEDPVPAAENRPDSVQTLANDPAPGAVPEYMNQPEQEMEYHAPETFRPTKTEEGDTE